MLWHPYLILFLVFIFVCFYLVKCTFLQNTVNYDAWHTFGSLPVAGSALESCFDVLPVFSSWFWNTYIFTWCFSCFGIGWLGFFYPFFKGFRFLCCFYPFFRGFHFLLLLLPFLQKLFPVWRPPDPSRPFWPASQGFPRPSKWDPLPIFWIPFVLGGAGGGSHAFFKSFLLFQRGPFLTKVSFFAKISFFNKGFLKRLKSKSEKKTWAEKGLHKQQNLKHPTHSNNQTPSISHIQTTKHLTSQAFKQLNTYTSQIFKQQNN